LIIICDDGLTSKEQPDNIASAKAFVAAAKALGSLVNVASVSWNYGGASIAKKYKFKTKAGETAIFSIYNSVPEFYTGDVVNGASIAQFGSDMVPYRGHTIVSSTELNQVLSRDMHRPKLVLFTQKKTVPLLFKLLSNTFAGQVDVCVHLNATRAEVMVGEQSLPALVTFRVDTVNHKQIPERYEGSLKMNEIEAHLGHLVALNGDNIGVSGPTTVQRFLLRRPLEPKILLLCDTSNVPLEYRALSQGFKGATVSFAIIGDTEERKKFMSQYHLWQVPEIAFFENGYTAPKMMPMISVKLISILLGRLSHTPPITSVLYDSTRESASTEESEESSASSSESSSQKRINEARALMARLVALGQEEEASKIEGLILQLEKELVKSKQHEAEREERSEMDKLIEEERLRGENLEKSLKEAEGGGEEAKEAPEGGEDSRRPSPRDSGVDPDPESPVLNPQAEEVALAAAEKKMKEGGTIDEQAQEGAMAAAELIMSEGSGVDEAKRFAEDFTYRFMKQKKYPNIDEETIKSAAEAVNRLRAAGRHEEAATLESKLAFLRSPRV